VSVNFACVPLVVRGGHSDGHRGDAAHVGSPSKVAASKGSSIGKLVNVVFTRPRKGDCVPRRHGELSVSSVAAKAFCPGKVVVRAPIMVVVIVVAAVALSRRCGLFDDQRALPFFASVVCNVAGRSVCPDEMRRSS